MVDIVAIKKWRDKPYAPYSPQSWFTNYPDWEPDVAHSFSLPSYATKLLFCWNRYRLYVKKYDVTRRDGSHFSFILMRSWRMTQVEKCSEIPQLSYKHCNFKCLSKSIFSTSGLFCSEKLFVFLEENSGCLYKNMKIKTLTFILIFLISWPVELTEKICSIRLQSAPHALTASACMSYSINTICMVTEAKKNFKERSFLWWNFFSVKFFLFSVFIFRQSLKHIINKKQRRTLSI